MKQLCTRNVDFYIKQNREQYQVDGQFKTIGGSIGFW